MTPLLLTALFVVGLLLSVRASERILTVVAAVATLAVLILLGAVSVHLPVGGGKGQFTLAGLQRVQGYLAVAAVILASAPFLLGRASHRSSMPRRPRPAPRPVRVQRTATPVPSSRRPTITQTMSDLRFQEYEVLDRIGIGGMGSVYRAKRRQDGRIVALKVPQEKYLADAKFVKRFYREAEVLKRFSHPNIVRVYDYRMQTPEHYIAMEFLDGDSLEGELEKRTLSFTEGVQVIRALADALRHIHMQNVVHRDIKPANVMVLKNAFVDGQLREGGVKLMDFGIAVGKVLTRLTMTGARVGTPIYMAPEQAKGNRVDARSDVYSLGLLAYEMVTGQTAFRGSYEAVVHQQVFESPKPPKQVRLEVPGKLNDLILHMIEKDPAQRPTLDDVIARIDAGVMSDEVFNDPVALALSVGEKRGTLRLLDVRGKLRQSLKDQGSGSASLPSAPNAVAGDAGGNLYITMAEFRQGKSGGLVRKINPEGRELLSFGPYGLSDGELLQPVDLAVTADAVYVLDAEAHHVVVYDTLGRHLRTFGGHGQGMGRFEKPRAIVASPDGQVYVLDIGNNEVQRFNAQGEYVSRYAFRLDRTSESLRQLDGLGIDQFGAVYIVDGVARKLRKIEADGTPGATFALETLVGEPADAPWLIEVAPEGQIFAVRQGGQVLRTFSNVGDLITQTDMYAPVLAMSILNREQALHHVGA
ncbi:serine/threonine-protein kinase [Deinococcus metalli]|uniref:non-specific serine/threonine protein kinase n=1 Tax=Deinococcus metalli TaxID=1141878 RepID=A0A7W8KHM9_9DEIO|nr:protein kinase [Deinococcus metalli]MBB5378272.1 serine/threonine-protein kinase [Deinococcus metalli]GHF57334.1 serine/threonine protein kinase [Deinococcus metalli]